MRCPLFSSRLQQTLPELLWKLSSDGTPSSEMLSLLQEQGEKILGTAPNLKCLQSGDIAYHTFELKTSLFSRHTS